MAAAAHGDHGPGMLGHLVLRAELVGADAALDSAQELAQHGLPALVLSSMRADVPARLVWAPAKWTWGHRLSRAVGWWRCLEIVPSAAATEQLGAQWAAQAVRAVLLGGCACPRLRLAWHPVHVHTAAGAVLCIAGTASDPSPSARLMEQFMPAAAHQGVPLRIAAARGGLMCSTSCSSQQPASWHVVPVPDITTATGVVCTDGAAGMGEAAAGSLWHDWVAQHAACWAAIAPADTSGWRAARDSVQGRVLGRKGVWYASAGVAASALQCRPSQLKVHSCVSNAMGMDMLRWHGTPAIPCANPQILALLFAWGVQPAAICEAGVEALRTLARINHDPSAAALWAGCTPCEAGCVPRSHLAAALAWAWPQAGSSSAARAGAAIAAGCTHLAEYQRLASAAQASGFEAAVQQLHVPLLQSARVVLVPDPTGLLAPGECVLTLRATGMQGCTCGTARHIAGPIVAARNPCLTAHDLATFTAVPESACWPRASDMERRKLSFPCNALVLSTQGDASAASRLSNGDYDGDVAWVCWDERVIAPVLTGMADSKACSPRAEEPGPATRLANELEAQLALRIEPEVAAAAATIDFSSWDASRMGQMLLARTGRGVSVSVGRAVNAHAAWLDELLRWQAAGVQPCAGWPALAVPVTLAAALATAALDAPKHGLPAAYHRQLDQARAAGVLSFSRRPAWAPGKPAVASSARAPARKYVVVGERVVPAPASLGASPLAVLQAQLRVAISSLREGMEPPLPARPKQALMAFAAQQALPDEVARARALAEPPETEPDAGSIPPKQLLRGVPRERWQLVSAAAAHAPWAVHRARAQDWVLSAGPERLPARVAALYAAAWQQKHRASQVLPRQLAWEVGAPVLLQLLSQAGSAASMPGASPQADA